MYPIQTAAEVLPDMWRLAGQVERGLQEARYSAPESLAAVWKVLLAPAVVEATARSLPVWRRIAAPQGGITARHTLLVPACSTPFHILSGWNKALSWRRWP